VGVNHCSYLGETWWLHVVSDGDMTPASSVDPDLDKPNLDRNRASLKQTPV